MAVAEKLDQAFRNLLAMDALMDAIDVAYVQDTGNSQLKNALEGVRMLIGSTTHLVDLSLMESAGRPDSDSAIFNQDAGLAG